MMNADPEQNPEEGFKVVHKGMLLVQKCTDGHECSRASPPPCSRDASPLLLDRKIKIYEKTLPGAIVGVLVYHEIVD